MGTESVERVLRQGLRETAARPTSNLRPIACTRKGVSTSSHAPFDNFPSKGYNAIGCPRGGIGIHSRLRACARKGVLVRVQSGALVHADPLGSVPSAGLQGCSPASLFPTTPEWGADPPLPSSHPQMGNEYANWTGPYAPLIRLFVPGFVDGSWRRQTAAADGRRGQGPFLFQPSTDSFIRSRIRGWQMASTNAVDSFIRSRIRGWQMATAGEGKVHFLFQPSTDSFIRSRIRGRQMAAADGDGRQRRQTAMAGESRDRGIPAAAQSARSFLMEQRRRVLLS